MSLVDTHFHLDMYRNHQSLYELINAKKQYTLCVTCSPGVFLSCKKIHPETKYVKYGLGIHPEEIINPEKEVFEFDTCVDQAQYIGEIGLDYSNPKTNKNDQLMVLRHVLDIQARRKLLASIHVKKAEDDLIYLLNEYPSPKRIIHWFTGTNAQLLKMLDAGCYFSVNASMIQTESGKKRMIQIPKERLLIESDGPYSKVNGKRFSPEKLGETYHIVASALQIQNLEELVYQNFFTILSV